MSELERRWLLIWMMPWAEFVDDFVFGSISFRNLMKIDLKSMCTPAEEDILRQFASHFRDRKGEQTRDMCLIHTGSDPFGTPNEEQRQKIRWASSAICFAHICRSIIDVVCGRQCDLGVSEQFQIMTMQIDDNGFLHYAEYGALGATDLKGNHIQFIEPPQILTKNSVVDRPLVEGLSRINEEHFGSDLWNRLKACFEWFSMAWAGASEVSYPARCISLMTAFEALVRLGDGDKAPAMAKAASSLCGWAKLPQSEELILDGDCQYFSKPFRFVYDFAQIRNTFVHGGGMKWGLVKYIVSENAFDQRYVMSVVLYNMIAARLLSEGVWLDCEAIIMQHRLKGITEALGWDRSELLSPSPHEEAPEGWQVLMPKYSDYISIEVAERAGVLRLTEIVASTPFTFLSISTNEDGLPVLFGGLLDEFRSNTLPLMIFRGFGGDPSGEICLEYGCLIPSEHFSEAAFREVVVRLLNGEVNQAIYSTGRQWGLLTNLNNFDIRDSVETFNAQVLRDSWSAITSLNFFLVETMWCSGARWSQFCRTRMNIRNGIVLSKQSLNDMQNELSAIFHRTQAGETVIVDGKHYECAGNQLWKVDGGPPSKPDKILRRNITRLLVRGAALCVNNM